MFALHRQGWGLNSASVTCVEFACSSFVCGDSPGSPLPCTPSPLDRFQVPCDPVLSKLYRKWMEKVREAMYFSDWGEPDWSFEEPVCQICVV